MLDRMKKIPLISKLTADEKREETININTHTLFFNAAIKVTHMFCFFIALRKRMRESPYKFSFPRF